MPAHLKQSAAPPRRSKGPSPRPAARGDFSETPFAHVLSQLHKHGVTGSLLIDVPDPRRTGERERMCIHVDGGVVCAAAAGPEYRALASLVVALCARTEGGFALYPEQDLTGDGGGILYGRFHPLELLTAAIRAHCREEACELVLSNLGESVLGLRESTDLRHYGFNTGERAFIRELNRQPATLRVLIERGPLPADRARRLLYLLALTEAVVPQPLSCRQVSGPVRVPLPGVGAGAAKVKKGVAARRTRRQGSYSIVSGAQAPTAEVVQVSRPGVERSAVVKDELPGPPRLLAPALRQRWVGLLLGFRRMQTQDHFQLLGVDRDADERSITAAYRQRSAPFQTERLPAEFEPLREQMREASRRFAMARHTLCDGELRERYCQELAQGRRSHRPAAQTGAKGAAEDFERATHLMKQRLYGTALEAARRAAGQDRRHPGYHALCGALLYLTAAHEPDAQRDAVRHLTLALRLDPDCAMAHHYRGMFFERAGDRERAMVHLRMALRIAPNNLEVARELRLLESRSRASGTSGLMRRIRQSISPGRKVG